jgi:hypothetical protein
MATTTNYGWSTPDDTALVKDGAAAIRTLGSSVDTTTKTLNPSTTLGDIEYRSSTANTNTRLGIGSTGQVLTVSGGVPAWTTPAGSGESWALVANGTTTSGSSLSLSGLGSYDKYMVVFAAFRPGTDDTMVVRVNNDSGSNYRYVIVAPTMTNGLTSAQTSSFGNLSLTSSDNAGALTFTISGCKSTSGFKKFFGDFLVTNASPSYIPKSYSGVWESNSAVTSIDLVLSTYSFANGTYRLYGSN